MFVGARDLTNARPYSEGGHRETGQRSTRSNGGVGTFAIGLISTNTAGGEFPRNHG